MTIDPVDVPSGYLLPWQGEEIPEGWQRREDLEDLETPVDPGFPDLVATYRQLGLKVIEKL